MWRFRDIDLAPHGDSFPFADRYRRYGDTERTELGMVHGAVEVTLPVREGFGNEQGLELIGHAAVIHGTPDTVLPRGAAKPDVPTSSIEGSELPERQLV